MCELAPRKVGREEGSRSSYGKKKRWSLSWYIKNTNRLQSQNEEGDGVDRQTWGSGGAPACVSNYVDKRGPKITIWKDLRPRDPKEEGHRTGGREQSCWLCWNGGGQQPPILFITLRQLQRVHPSITHIYRFEHLETQALRKVLIKS